jgi:hypothetical protein
MANHLNGSEFNLCVAEGIPSTDDPAWQQDFADFLLSQANAVNAADLRITPAADHLKPLSTGGTVGAEMAVVAGADVWRPRESLKLTQPELRNLLQAAVYLGIGLVGSGKLVRPDQTQVDIDG